MKSKTYIGIDPGQQGGIAFIDAYLRNARTYPMPVAGKEIDVFMIKLLCENNITEEPLAVIEKVHAMPGQGVSSTFKFGFNTGILHGIFRALEIPLYLVTPQAWKKEILAGTLKDKDAAIDFCRRVYPTVNLLATERSRVPHSGMADALCIARYATVKFGDSK